MPRARPNSLPKRLTLAEAPGQDALRESFVMDAVGHGDYQRGQCVASLAWEYLKTFPSWGRHDHPSPDETTRALAEGHPPSEANARALAEALVHAHEQGWPLSVERGSRMLAYYQETAGRIGGGSGQPDEGARDRIQVFIERVEKERWLDMTGIVRHRA